MVLLRAVAHLCAITSIAAMIGTLYHIASHTRTGVVQPSGPGTYYTQLVTFASHLASSYRKHTYLPPLTSVVGLADVGAMSGQENVGGPRLRHQSVVRRTFLVRHADISATIGPKRLAQAEYARVHALLSHVSRSMF